VILRGALHIEWQQLLVVSVFIITLGYVLRYSGIQPRSRQKEIFVKEHGEAA
jgi:hypothetical protein